jgi:hypothetical protein
MIMIQTFNPTMDFVKFVFVIVLLTTCPRWTTSIVSTGQYTMHVRKNKRVRCRAKYKVENCFLKTYCAWSEVTKNFKGASIIEHLYIL